MMNEHFKIICRDLRRSGGRLEWASRTGIGVSFDNYVSDDNINDLISILNKAVWINLENTSISDRSLKLIENLPLLESLRLNGTVVTQNSIISLLQKCHSLRCLELSRDILDGMCKEDIIDKFPHVTLVES